jgi:transposase
MAAYQKKGHDLGATIVFVDESGFSLRPSVRRTWAPKGQTPIIRHHFNWKRLHAVGAICCKPDGSAPSLHIQLQAVPVNSDSTIAFIDALHQSLDGQVTLVWDGLPAHRSTKVTKHVEAQEWLTVERLPAYAPELNPVEYLWAAIKNKDLANICVDTIEQLGGRLEQAYTRFDTERTILTGCLKASKLYD